MAQNDFKSFAVGAGANVTPQADWEALAALVTGFQSGKASSAQINKAIRQASFIAAALAQYTSDKTGVMYWMMAIRLRSSPKWLLPLGKTSSLSTPH